MPSPRLLQKLKRHASALVLRPTPSRPREEDIDFVAIPTVSPYIHVTHSHSTLYDDDDICLPLQTDDFVPYLPLVSQYERAALLANTDNNLKVITDGHTIFSRPASAITSSDPPTPIFTTHYSSDSTWSLSTADSIPSPTPYPFEKGSIQVVRHSISMHENLLRKRVAPATPPPPPPSSEEEEEADVQLVRVRETEEWTLKLNLPPSRKSSSPPKSKPKPKPAPTPHLLQPPPMHKHQRTPQRHASQPQMHTHIKPKPKIMRIQIEPENALDIDKDDWTLSLPLALPHPPGISGGGGVRSAPCDALTFAERGEEKEGRRRYTSQPGPRKKEREREQSTSHGVRERKSVQSLPSSPPMASLCARAAVSYANLKSAPVPAIRSGPAAPAPAPVPVGIKSQDPPRTHARAHTPPRLRTADSVSSSASASTITPAHVPLAPVLPSTPPPPPTPTTPLSLCSHCSRTLPSPTYSVPPPLPSPTSAYSLPSPLPSPTSTYSFADSGVGMITSAMAGDGREWMEREREREREEMRWVDGVRLPSTPNLNGGWRGGDGDGEWKGEEGQGQGEEGDGDGDGVSISGHSMYYSARSSVCFSSEACA